MASFAVRDPLVPVEGSRAAVGDSSAATGKRILLVDDNPDICAFMSTALEAAGYEVIIAAEGERALGLQRIRPADLLITDIFMPVKEGIETISSFRAEFPQARIIAMSACGTSGKRDFLGAAKLLGADATLRKPFAADQLLDAVHNVLHARPE